MSTFTQPPTHQPNQTAALISIKLPDGEACIHGLTAVNAVLRQAGVYISQISIPKEAIPILEQSEHRKLTDEERDELVSLFPLHRGELLEVIAKAGRQPEAKRGGFLNSAEYGSTPYPKVVDLKAIPVDDVDAFHARLARLHTNSSEDGIGIDKVMTIVSGGSTDWFFKLAGSTVAKVTLGAVALGGQAWRISYPGIGIHGCHLKADDGVFVAYAHGPRNFVVRYADESVENAELLGTNPWLEFASGAVKLCR